MCTTEGKREQEEEICVRDRINGPSRSSFILGKSAGGTFLKGKADSFQHF